MQPRASSLGVLMNIHRTRGICGDVPLHETAPRTAIGAVESAAAAPRDVFLRVSNAGVMIAAMMCRRDAEMKYKRGCCGRDRHDKKRHHSTTAAATTIADLGPQTSLHKFPSLEEHLSCCHFCGANWHAVAKWFSLILAGVRANWDVRPAKSELGGWRKKDTWKNACRVNGVWKYDRANWRFIAVWVTSIKMRFWLILMLLDTQKIRTLEKW